MKPPGICYRERDSDNCSGYATGHESPGRLQRVLFRGQTIVRITPPVKTDPGNPDYPEPEPEQFIGLCTRQVESEQVFGFPTPTDGIPEPEAPILGGYDPASHPARCYPATLLDSRYSQL